jgi:hypothetical protein
MKDISSNIEYRRASDHACYVRGIFEFENVARRETSTMSTCMSLKRN